MPVNAVPTYNIEEASGGNAALRNLLTQLAQQTSTQITKTNTSNKPAPKQPTATVTFSNPFYVVNITNPENQRPASTQQASQQTGAALIGANANLSQVFNQVRAANSLLFDAASNVQIFGGDLGSTLTQFVIPGLDPKLGWFFQVRSSFDGNTWNQWKTINSGNPLDVNAEAVTLQPNGVGNAATFFLPGGLAVGFGVQTVFDQLVVTPIPGATIADCLGIAGPNGFTDAGHQADGVKACNIDITGVVSMQYTDGDGSDTWSGTANALLFGWNTLSAQAGTTQKPTLVAVTGGQFAVFILPGGARFCIGSGRVASGAAFTLPTGFSAADSMTIVSAASVDTMTNPAHGILNASADASLVCTVEYADGSGHTWTGGAQWFCIAWEPALQANVHTVAGGKFLIINTPSGPIALGMGSSAGGSVIPLPSGYSWIQAGDIPKAIAFVTPATFVDSGHPFHGVQLCAVDQNGSIALVYADGQGNQWSGNVNWFAMAWL